MQITAAMVNDLRQKTGVGMMTCKKALVEAEGNAERAVEILRKRCRRRREARWTRTPGKAACSSWKPQTRPPRSNSAAKRNRCPERRFRSSRSGCRQRPSKRRTSLRSMNSRTLPWTAPRSTTASGRAREDPGEHRFPQARRDQSIPAPDVFGLYSHMGGKVGVVVRLEYTGTPSDTASLKRTAKDIAMQASAFSPVAVNNAAVPAGLSRRNGNRPRSDRERGKTKPEFVDRQIAGRVNKVLQGTRPRRSGILHVGQETRSASPSGIT